MHLIKTVFTLVLVAISALAAGSLEAGDGSAAEALKAEVGELGWIVLAAHPAEIDGGTIIEKKAQRGPLDLYLVRPDGSRLRNITGTDQFHEFGGRFSPDGKRLLYRRLPKEAAINHDLWGETGELVVARADGSEPVVQGEAGEFPWASFNPDATQIACFFKKEQVIRIFDFASKAPVKEIPSQGVFQQVFWSPDGKRLVGTANVARRNWNVVSLEIATGKMTLLTRALNCTPDWFQGDAQRVIYSNRNPALFRGEYDNYGLTMLMWASADGKTRKLIYGNAGRHCYFGCTSPDDKYVVFSDDAHDGLVVGEMHVIRMDDTPIIPEGIKKIRLLHPGWKEGPVLDLKSRDNVPLRGFEPHWTFAKIGE